MTQNELLISRLKAYGKSDAAPFHMPGHKRRTDWEPIVEFPNPFSVDITEIEGFDNLHHPEGLLKNSMEWAAGVYGTERTWYLVNGSSSGILSAVCSAVRPGGRLLMARNCHKSAYHGVILNHLKTAYIYPQIAEPLGIQGGISAADVEISLSRYPDTQAVLVVSPTYDGMVSNVRAIGEVAHRHGIPLIVDEAHGAHFSFGQGSFPHSALEEGADLVIQSLHKTLPALTQTAVIHLNSHRIDAARLCQYLQIFQTSSPSYVLMASIELCIFQMEKQGNRLLDEFAQRLGRLREALGSLECLRLAGMELKGRKEIFDVDLSKLVISCRDCEYGQESMNGERLGKWLRDEYHIEMEMCAPDYVVAILSFMDREDSVKRLETALLSIDRKLVRKGEDREWETFQEPEIGMDLADAREASWEQRNLEDCVGRVSAEFIYLYPPGIPIAAPGEILTEAIIKNVVHHRETGLSVQGMADPKAKMLRVIEKPEKITAGAEKGHKRT